MINIGLTRGSSVKQNNNFAYKLGFLLDKNLDKGVGTCVTLSLEVHIIISVLIQKVIFSM
jgi:hypothetical protein